MLSKFLFIYIIIFLQTHLVWFFLLTNSIFVLFLLFFYFFFLLHALTEIESSECTGRSIVLYIFSRTHLNKNTLSIVFYNTLYYLNLLTSILLDARLSLTKRREREKKDDEGYIFRSFLGVCSNSHRNSSTRTYGPFLLRTSRVDTLLHIQHKCRFHVRLNKELGL